MSHPNPQEEERSFVLICKLCKWESEKSYSFEDVFEHAQLCRDCDSDDLEIQEE